MQTETPEYATRSTEKATKINTGILKTNSTYGNYVVYADASFNKGNKQWEYPNKAYFFFTKKMAKYFIENFKSMTF
jgi:hypothetical protein